MVKNLPAMQETWARSLGLEDPLAETMATHSNILSWRMEWQPIPVFLPGKSHGQRNLAGYSPWGRKGLDTTERLSLAHSWSY